MLFEKFKMKQRFRCEMHYLMLEKEALLKAEVKALMEETDPEKARHHVSMMAEYAREVATIRRLRDMKIKFK